jgi:hypothetical protein
MRGSTKRWESPNPNLFSKFVVGEVPIRVRVLLTGEGHQRVFLNLRSMGTSPYVNNSLFISSLLSHFIEKKYFHGNMRIYNIGGAPLLA